MKLHILTAGLALFALAPDAAAQPLGRGAMTSPVGAPVTARPYLVAAASADQFEIQSSQLALRMSRDAEVRRTAQMLINDHQRLSAETMAAARRARLVPPPVALTPEHAAKLRELSKAGAERFDAAYRQAQVAAHQEALALHRGYANSGDVPALRTTAAKAVPVVEMHLHHVEQNQHRQ
jgi:putative membrane protein